MTPRPRSARRRRSAATPPAPTPRAAGPVPATRWTRWIAYALIVAYGVYWAVQVFTRHHWGNMAVETDFYWKYGPAARDLLRGVLSIDNYDSKGWGYPVVVALVSRLGIDVFRAAQIVALLSAVGVAWIVYRLHKSLFGPSAALASLAVVLGNINFLTNTYEVGTDMFFLLVTFASLAFLLRSRVPGWRALLLSGALGGWAFSTRYNALFLLPGALLLFFVYRVPEGPPATRRRGAALWTAAFVIGALPWLVVNAIHTGNPLTNSNYLNVGYAVYGKGNWDSFFFGHREIHTLVDVIRIDPLRFAGVMVTNFFDHLWKDAIVFLPWILGGLAIAGAALMLRDRPGGRRVAGYFTMGALLFGTLVPVFYGVRLSLPMLPFYAALAAWPLVSPTLGRALGAVERVFPVRAFLFVLLLLPIAFGSYGGATDPRWPEAVQIGPYELRPTVDYLRQHAAPGDALLARKPHAAFLAGMRFVPMEVFDTPDSLRAMATEAKARYVLVSGAEVAMRAGMQPFANPPYQVPGFRRVFSSQGALLYEVLPQAPAAPKPTTAAPAPAAP